MCTFFFLIAFFLYPIISFAQKRSKVDVLSTRPFVKVAVIHTENRINVPAAVSHCCNSFPAACKSLLQFISGRSCPGLRKSSLLQLVDPAAEFPAQLPVV